MRAPARVEERRSPDQIVGAASAANLLAAEVNGKPVSSASIAATASPKPAGALKPVPTAVPPIASARPGQDRVDPREAGVELRDVAKLLTERAAPRLADECGRSSRRRRTRAPCASASRNARTLGTSRRVRSSAAATCMAVGNVSLDDCDMFTWSFGWIGSLLPSLPPASSIARFAMTSFAFMLVWVPEPVCQTESGKWSSSWPAITSSAARTISSARRLSRRPSFWLTSAAAFFRRPRGANDRDGHPVVADREMVERALGLSAPVAVGADFDPPHAVALDAGLRSHTDLPGQISRYP